MANTISIGTSATAVIPTRVFAFSDQKITVTDITSDTSLTSVSLTCNGVTETRNFYDGAAEFSLKPFIVMAHDVTNINHTPTTAISESAAMGTLSVTFTASDESTATASVNYTYGTISVDKSLTGERRLYYNPNFPFTVDIDACDQYEDEDGNAVADVTVIYDTEILNTRKVIKTTTAIVTGTGTRYRFSNFKLAYTPATYCRVVIPDCVDYQDGEEVYKELYLNMDVDNRTSGIYLRWLDPYGRLCYRLFSETNEEYTRQAETYTSGEDVAVNFTYSGGEGYNSGANKFASALTLSHTITVGIALQNSQQLEELSTLATSDFVDVFLGYDGTIEKWQRVNVSDVTIDFDTKKLQQFEITIELPTEKVQTR